ncbi:MAG: CBS domain-containing protein, partial [Cytophagales bacterium]
MQAPHPLVSDQFYSKKVKDLLVRSIRWVTPETSIQTCAQYMAQEQVSCLFIGYQAKQLIGYITDLTLRDQVLAVGLDPGTKVEMIMEKDLISISPESSLVEALLLMFQSKARYLLVGNEQGFLGWISRTKVLTEQSQGP